MGNIENMAIWVNRLLPSVAHTQYATRFYLRRLGEMFCSVSFLSPPHPLMFKISHPRLQTLKMLGATLIQSKEEDCSLRKARNRLLLRGTLRNFFCLQLHPSVCSISLELPQNQDREIKMFAMHWNVVGLKGGGFRTVLEMLTPLWRRKLI